MDKADQKKDLEVDKVLNDGGASKMNKDERIQYNRKLLKANNDELEEDHVDKLLNQQIFLLNGMTKRQELNNFIIRFTNFMTSVPVKINLQDLDLIRDQTILGIKPPNIEEDLEDIQKQKMPSLYTDEVNETNLNKTNDCNPSEIPQNQ